MHPVEFILYVADQGRARDFYAAVLGQAPALDVPGMTAFDLGAATLGLMPAAGIEGLLGPTVRAREGLRAGPRCELYLRRSDAPDCLERACAAGGRALSPLTLRSWGEHVGYVLDLDGHVLAVAQAD